MTKSKIIIQVLVCFILTFILVRLNISFELLSLPTQNEIKEISYNILANLGIVFINEHPLRVTIILWVIFNILICYFIWRPRLHRNKKQIKII